MTIHRCFVKPQRGSACVSASEVFLRVASGIDGDVHADAASPRQILLLSRKTLKDEGIPAGALSENFVVDADVDGLVSGSHFRIGEAELQIMFPCEVCGKISKIRKGLATQLAGRRGILARVVKGGNVGVGDDVDLLGRPFRRFATEPRNRFYELLRTVPYGKVLPSTWVTRVIGVHRTYVRVFPKYLRAAPEDVPAHRLVLNKGRVQNQHPEEHKRLLTSEGVDIEAGGIVPDSFFWDPRPFLSQ